LDPVARVDITSCPKLRTIKLLTFCQFAEGIPLCHPLTPPFLLPLFMHIPHFCHVHSTEIAMSQNGSCLSFHLPLLSISTVSTPLTVCSFPVCWHYFVSHFFNLLIYLPLFVRKIANRIMAKRISKLRVLVTRWRASECQAA